MPSDERAVYFPIDLYDRCRAIAEREERTIKTVVRRIVEHGVEEYEAKVAAENARKDE